MTTTFFINAKPYTVDLAQLPSDMTLNTFIRDHAGLTGTKYMCREGGCGICICVVTGKDPATKQTRTWAVNSCLTLLNSCTDWHITTVEGIGSKRNGYHPIQKRLAKLNGTQCGFCSPGFVMNMYGLLASEGVDKLTMADIENSFGGNICRCTGYRPILDAMKSFAVDSDIPLPEEECRDIEDLSSKICPKSGSPCNGTCNGIAERKPLIYADGAQWYWPKSLDNLFSIFEKLQSDKYILVAGNTAHGVYRRTADIRTFIDINGIAELRQYSLQSDSLVLGANLTLTDAMKIFQEAAKKPGFEYCQELWNHFDAIANVPVRNMGTLAGNLSIKHQYKEFPSDVFILFEALDVQVVLNEGAIEGKTVSLANYLKTPMAKKILHSFVLRPYPAPRYTFASYKIMPRAQNAHAYVNAAFLFNLEPPSHKVISARICFGGINPDFVHATALEESLVGKQLFDSAVAATIFKGSHSYMKADTVLPEPSPEYREKLAYNLLYKFLLSHAPTGTIASKLVSGGEVLKRPVSRGKQTFEIAENNFPVSKPTQKVEALIQCAGEATYANDVPAQPGQLWAVFVTAKKVGANIQAIDASEALSLSGVEGFFTAKDIPGENNIIVEHALFCPARVELFVSETVKFYDQPVGVLVAKTQDLAERAAELVKLTYSAGSTEVMSGMEQVLSSACADRIEHIEKSAIKTLNDPEEFDFSATGTLDMGLQYHFFMEPQSTVVLPIEGTFQVHAATQWMDLLQNVISKLLKLKTHEIQLKVRRVGGGYGGKATNCNPPACAAALAAFKLNRPVRFVQSIESMMRSAGKRWAFHADYDFFTKRDGKIIALRVKFYEDAGCGPNESPLGHTVLLSKNCYEFSDNYKLDGHLVYTDSPSNTACRAPGSVESIAMIENVIEHIAFVTGLDPLEVRKANMITGHKMSEMLAHFVQTTDYKQRKQEIAQFNERNRWRKRGLGLTVMEYHMGYFGNYAATVAIYHADGTVVISHGGIEMGQGMNTKIVQVAAHTLGIPTELIRVEDSNTLNGANSMVTGGSIGSESLCLAVRKCCNQLNERLNPIKEAAKDADWPTLVTQAYDQKINLIANDDCKQFDLEPYTVCALGLTEVDVDILTGNYLVQRVDILEDVGESLNPSIDIGQIEGAFMMGLGYWTSERIVVDQSTGEVKTNRTWNYKPPGPKDIPIDFRIEMMPRSPNAAGFMRSKASGEPAICLSVSVGFALQEALQSARDDAGLKKSWVPLTAPMTPEHVLLNSGTEISMLKL